MSRPVCSLAPLASGETALRDYRLAAPLRSIVSMFARISCGDDKADQSDPEWFEGSRVFMRVQGHTVELLQLDAHELASGDQARLRLRATLHDEGQQTRVCLTVEKPHFVQAVLQGDIVPEAVGWGAAFAISLFQGLISQSLQAALVSFGISALGLLTVRLGTAFCVWRRARRCVDKDLQTLLALVHTELAPQECSDIRRY